MFANIIFGVPGARRIVEGMDLVDKIAAVKTGVKFDMRDVPMESIIVKSAKVVTDTPKAQK